MANTEQYRAVLDDLVKQRSQLQFRIGEIDTAVMALRRIMPEESLVPAEESQQRLPVAEGVKGSEGKYAGMSTRWAILALLSEDSTPPMTTGQIAEALQAAGITSNGKSFAGNVSAVLSGMNHDKGEVTSGMSGWVISDKGKDAWISIKASRERKGQFIKASLPIVQ